MDEKQKQHEKYILKQIKKDFKQQKKIEKQFFKLTRKKLNKVYRDFVKEERDQIVFSLVGAVCSMSAVVLSTMANVKNRNPINVLVFLAGAAFSVINGLSVYFATENLKVKNKQFKELVEKTDLPEI